MSRLGQIERELIGINDVVFQELCDSFLSVKIKTYKSIFRNGSQTGKQKSTIGTPDVAFLLDNGMYIFGEHSTNVSEGIPKVIDDIKKCLNPTKTGISIEKIQEIIICTNFKITSKENEVLEDELVGTRIRLRVYSLQGLALELYHSNSDLVQEYLGLKFNRGQIVELSTFIANSITKSNEKIALFNNPFVGRNDELNSIVDLLENQNVVLISGPSGVGKTRLALEAMNKYILTNHDTKAFCLSYKFDSLIEDFALKFKKNNTYLFLVDDANRIDSLRQILSLITDSNYSNVKLLMTIRDYAAYDMEYMLYSKVKYKKIEIEKLNDEDIKNILENNPFKISSSIVLQDIAQIADGNPRIAMMAAQLYKTTGQRNSLSNVSKIYLEYFDSIISDNKNEFDEDAIKSLGLVSFFYSLPIKSYEKLHSIIEYFGLSNESFHEKLDLLNRIEIVQIQYDTVRINDQNLSSYFFYRCFIKDNVLSFTNLLNHYFDTHTHRFTDCVVAANNMFGSSEIYNALHSPLNSYLNLLYKSKKDVYKLLATFWWILKDEGKLYLYREISSLPTTDIEELSTEYERNQFSHNTDQKIKLMSNYFTTYDGLKDIIDLSILYVQKKPSLLPELVYTFRSYLLIRYEDYDSCFYRQNILLDVLTDETKGNVKVKRLIFYEIAKDLLFVEFQYTTGIGKGSISINTITIPSGKAINALRSRVWNFIEDNFERDRELCLKLISFYPTFRSNKQKDIIYNDLEQLLEILKKNINKNIFEESVIVFNLRRRLILLKIDSKKLSSLVKNITTDILIFYDIMSWKWINEMFWTHINHRDFQKLKIEQLRTKITLDSVNEIKTFISNFKRIVLIEENKKSKFDLYKCLDHIVQFCFKKDFDLGIYLLKTILIDNDVLQYHNTYIMHDVMKLKNSTKKVISALSEIEYSLKPNWLLVAYEAIGEENINVDKCKEIVEILKDGSSQISPFFKNWKKYYSLDDEIFIKMLYVVFERNVTEPEKVYFWLDFYDEFYSYVNKDLDIVKKSYLQQIELHDNFDYEGKGLLNIIKDDKSFLIDFFKKPCLHEYPKNRKVERDLSIIWEVDDIENTLESVIIWLVKEDYFIGVLDHITNIFFSKLDDKYLNRSKRFIFRLVEKYSEDSQVISVLSDIATKSFDGFLKDVMLKYLEFNSDPEHFSKITWISTNGVFSGNSFSSDRKINSLLKIKDIVDELSGYKFIPIKSSIIAEIEFWKKRAIQERKERFGDPFHF